jgi:cell division protein FtsQ
MTALLAATAGRLAPLPRSAGRAAARVPLWLWLALVLLAAALAGGWLWLRDSPLVAVRQVRVVGAAGPEARQVRAALQDAARGMTTLHVDTAALRTAVSPYPIVHDLRVSAHPPHRLTIAVEAERPMARLTADGHATVVSASGKVLRGAFPGVRLPAIAVTAAPAGPHAVGRLTLAAVHAVAAAPVVLRRRIQRALWTGDRGLVLSLRDGPDLVLGDAGRLAAKWMAAARVLADASSRGASYLDVRVPERPAAGGVAPAGQGSGAAAGAADAPAASTVTPAAPATTPVTPVAP